METVHPLVWDDGHLYCLFTRPNSHAFNKAVYKNVPYAIYQEMLDSSPTSIFFKKIYNHYPYKIIWREVHSND